MMYQICAAAFQVRGEPRYKESTTQAAAEAKHAPGPRAPAESGPPFVHDSGK